jgi:2,4-dienoyl-CoA reductase-like NADH-dependent reductase (Old Yellow Enzyme family)
MTEFPHLFSPLSVGGLTLTNRITMAPLYVAYAEPDGRVGPQCLAHYREMGASGAAMVVVENALVDLRGQGGANTIRADEDRFLDGLSRLAETIQAGGARAALQLNHAGRYARTAEAVAPSPVAVGDNRPPRALEVGELAGVAEKYAAAAARVRRAGFDLIELHGGTGYLLAEFLSPRTNRRTDDYGGDLEHRLRFPREVIAAVREAVGPDFPIGYRFLADEWLPDGFQLAEAVAAAPKLAETGLAYLSVMGGTYESFYLPERQEQDRRPGYMADLAAAVKGAVDVPVIAAGRIQDPALAEEIVAQGRADLVGLARVLFADPRWPLKAKEGRADEIVPCEPTCRLCFKRASQGQPLICSQWTAAKRDAVTGG